MILEEMNEEDVRRMLANPEEFRLMVTTYSEFHFLAEDFPDQAGQLIDHITSNFEEFDRIVSNPAVFETIKNSHLFPEHDVFRKPTLEEAREEVLKKENDEKVRKIILKGGFKEKHPLVRFGADFIFWREIGGHTESKETHTSDQSEPDFTIRS